jgi:hypothetical protein
LRPLAYALPSVKSSANPVARGSDGHPGPRSRIPLCRAVILDNRRTRRSSHRRAGSAICLLPPALDRARRATRTVTDFWHPSKRSRRRGHPGSRLRTDKHARRCQRLRLRAHEPRPRRVRVRERPSGTEGSRAHRLLRRHQAERSRCEARAAACRSRPKRK